MHSVRMLPSHARRLGAAMTEPPVLRIVPDHSLSEVVLVDGLTALEKRAGLPEALWVQMRMEDALTHLTALTQYPDAQSRPKRSRKLRARVR